MIIAKFNVFINRRDVNYLSAALIEDNYRKVLTSALNQCVDGHKTYKYSQVTDYIYKAVFKENAKEYRNVLSLDTKDNVRHTLYAEVLLVISSFENGVGAAIQKEFKDNGGVKLSMCYSLDARSILPLQKFILLASYNIHATNIGTKLLRTTSFDMPGIMLFAWDSNVPMFNSKYNLR